MDLVGPERATAWHTYLASRHPEAQIVQAESYKERQGVLTDGRGSKKFVDPHIPPALLSDLQSALKVAHKRLLEPPAEVLQDERRLKNWKPSVRETVDWDAALDGTRLNAPPEITDPTTVASSEEGAEELEKRYITVGLIGDRFLLHFYGSDPEPLLTGQPNVGKSSLLNAIFGAHKVRASRTPGKVRGLNCSRSG